MSSVTPTIPVGVLTPANIYPKHSPAADAAPKQPPAESAPANLGPNIDTAA